MSLLIQIYRKPLSTMYSYLIQSFKGNYWVDEMTYVFIYDSFLPSECTQSHISIYIKIQINRAAERSFILFLHIKYSTLIIHFKFKLYSTIRRHFSNR